MWPVSPFMNLKSKMAKMLNGNLCVMPKQAKLPKRKAKSAALKIEAFKKNSKVTEKQAIDIGLKAYPGIVQEVEYEIEENGDASYEIDIINDKGEETKVEVNAANGKIIEVSKEEWEVGEEADEKR